MQPAVGDRGPVQKVTAVKTSPDATVSRASWLTSFRAELDATQRYEPSSSLATSRICSTPVGREMNLLQVVERWEIHKANES